MISLPMPFIFRNGRCASGLMYLSIAFGPMRMFAVYSRFWRLPPNGERRLICYCRGKRWRNVRFPAARVALDMRGAGMQYGAGMREARSGQIFLRSFRRPMGRRAALHACAVVLVLVAGQAGWQPAALAAAPVLSAPKPG